MTVQRPEPHEIFEDNPTIPQRNALHVAHKRLTHRELCWFVLDKNPEKYGPGALRLDLAPARIQLDVLGANASGRFRHHLSSD